MVPVTTLPVVNPSGNPSIDAFEFTDVLDPYKLP